MKRTFLLLLVVVVLTLSSTVVNAAAEYHQDWSHPAYQSDAWRQSESRADESLPLGGTNIMTGIVVSVFMTVSGQIDFQGYTLIGGMVKVSGTMVTA